MGRAWLFTLILGLSLFSYAATTPPAAPSPPASLCANLSPAEQEFAATLSEVHRGLFCGQFTGDQRAQVLALMLSKVPANRGLSGDEAVEMILKNCRMMRQMGSSGSSLPPAPAARPTNRPRGSCNATCPKTQS